MKLQDYYCEGRDPYARTSREAWAASFRSAIVRADSRRKAESIFSGHFDFLPDLVVEVAAVERARANGPILA